MAFGPVMAFQVGWLLWLSRIAGFAAVCNLSIGYFAYFVPASGADLWRTVAIVGAVSAVAIANIIGIRVVAVAMALEKAAAIFRQDHRLITITGGADGLDQPLLAKVSQVARAWVGRAIVVVPEITTGNHPKRANGRERTRLRAAQGVLAVAVANDLPLQSPRQTDMPRERVLWLPIALTTMTVAFGPTHTIVAIASVFVRRVPVVSWTAAERSGILVIAVARSAVGLPPVVIAIPVVRGGTVPAIRSAPVPLVVARVAVARVEIKHRDLQLKGFP